MEGEAKRELVSSIANAPAWSEFLGVIQPGSVKTLIPYRDLRYRLELSFGRAYA